MSDLSSTTAVRVAELLAQELEEIATLPTDMAAFKNSELPLARIKKIMKLDEDIRGMMIAAEAPLLFSKAAELLIKELTYRAWIHTERSRRRTLQRADISASVYDQDTDQFDFLIDIVPREEVQQAPPGSAAAAAATPSGSTRHHHGHQNQSQTATPQAGAAASQPSLPLQQQQQLQSASVPTVVTSLASSGAEGGMFIDASTTPVAALIQQQVQQQQVQQQQVQQQPVQYLQIAFMQPPSGQHPQALPLQFAAAAPAAAPVAAVATLDDVLGEANMQSQQEQQYDIKPDISQVVMATNAAVGGPGVAPIPLSFAAL